MARQEAVTIRARVPASSANLGPGFDIFSVALESPYLEVDLTPAPSGTRRIIVEGVDGAEKEADPRFNSAGIALEALAADRGKPNGYVLRIRGNIPPTKGLGRSGAEAVGAILCADRKFKLGIRGVGLVQMAGRAEPSNHLDNVSAAALGGFNIVTRTSAGQQEVTTIRPPKELGVAIVVPNVEKPSTEAARKVVPAQIRIAEHVQTVGQAARASAAFARGDVQAILETLPWDGVVEPARANHGLYGAGVDAGYLWEEKKMLLEKFNVAETISGAGPAKALWYSISQDHNRKRKNRVGTIQPAIALVTERLRSLGHEVQDLFVTRPSSKGAEIITHPRRR